jgi:hypothetical protein
MSEFASSTWSKYTAYQNLWGTTETLSPPVLVAKPDEHGYAIFDLENSGIVFRDAKVTYHTEEGIDVPLYEPYFTLTPKSAPYSVWHLCRGITPESQTPPYPEYSAGDLWTPHPDPKRAHYVWRFVGRTDDLITFGTGVNLHPGPIESAILKDKLVQAALLVGAGRKQTTLLVELAQGVEPNDEARERIWEEAIEPGNQQIQTHGRISKTHVVLLPAGSFVRTPKGELCFARVLPMSLLTLSRECGQETNTKQVCKRG